MLGPASEAHSEDSIGIDWTLEGEDLVDHERGGNASMIPEGKSGRAETVEQSATESTTVTDETDWPASRVVSDEGLYFKLSIFKTGNEFRITRSHPDGRVLESMSTACILTDLPLQRSDGNVRQSLTKHWASAKSSMEILCCGPMRRPLKSAMTAGIFQLRAELRKGPAERECFLPLCGQYPYPPLSSSISMCNYRVFGHLHVFGCNRLPWCE